MAARNDKPTDKQARSGKTTVLNQGYLKKKSPKTFLGIEHWQERFFVLESDKFLYYESDRARSMGAQPSGVIPVTEIRSVSVPQDHRKGCRLDLEATSRRVFELQAATPAECQRWIDVLTTQGRIAGTLTDLSDEKAVDAQHERDLAEMRARIDRDRENRDNKDKDKDKEKDRDGDRDGGGDEGSSSAGAAGGGGGDRSSTNKHIQALAEPDFCEDELMLVDAEVLRDVEQFSLSVSIDLFGASAAAVAPFVVLLGPTSASSSSAQSIGVTRALQPGAGTASSASVAYAAMANGSASSSAAPPSDNLEVVLADPAQHAALADLAGQLRCLPVLNLYHELRAFRQCISAAQQSTSSTNIWQRFLKKGAVDFVPFSPLVAAPPVGGATSPMAGESPTTPASPVAAAAASSHVRTTSSPNSPIVQAVHDALKRRAVTLSTFDAMAHEVLAMLRGQLWPEYARRNPAVLSSHPTQQPGLGANPSALHRSQRRIGGSYSSGLGVTIRAGAGGAGIPHGWEEVCRTEVLPRLSKKALQLDAKSSSSSSGAASSSAATGSGTAADGGERGNQRVKHSLAVGGGGGGDSLRTERRHFDVLCNTHLEMGTSAAFDRRIRKLNGIDALAEARARVAATSAAAAANRVANAVPATPSSGGPAPGSSTVPPPLPTSTRPRRLSSRGSSRESIDAALVAAAAGYSGGAHAVRRRSATVDVGSTMRSSIVGASAAATTTVTPASVLPRPSRPPPPVSTSMTPLQNVASDDDGDESEVDSARGPLADLEEGMDDDEEHCGDEGSDTLGPVSPSSSRSAPRSVGQTSSPPGHGYAPSSAPVAGALAQSLTGTRGLNTLSGAALSDPRGLKTLRFHLYHAAEGNNDDLGAQVLLGRMECTLREVLQAANGELSRALFMSTEGPGAQLSGFVHVMFHERRVVRVANTPRYAYRSYIFRDVLGSDLVCHEALQESPLTWSLPHAALLRGVDHARIMRKQLMLALSEVDAELVRSASTSKSASSVEEDSAKRQLSSFLQRQVKAFTAVIAQWEKLVKLHYNYAGSYRGLRFKPSVEKSNKALAFVPVNLHVQSFAVTRTGRNRTRPEPSSLLSSASPMLGPMSGGIGGGVGTGAGAGMPRSTPLLTSSRSVQLNSSAGAAGLGGASGGAGGGTGGVGGGVGSSGGGGDGIGVVAPAPVEATSFAFESEDFLAELRDKAQAIKKAAPPSATASSPSSAAATAAAVGSAQSISAPSSANGSSPPSDVEQDGITAAAASSPLGSDAPQQQQQSPVPRLMHAPGSLAAKRLMFLRSNSARGLTTRPQPASAQTKAVAQMIANSHAMAAASYGGPAVNALPYIPAFLSLGGPGTGGSGSGGGGGGDDHLSSVDGAEEKSKKKKDHKLLFTAEGDTQQLVAYVPAGAAPSLAALAGAEGSSVEKARLVRRVPPRSPWDRTFTSHNYVNTTCGAFSAHAMGFKQGGVSGGEMKLLTKLYDLLGKHAADCVAMKTRPAGYAGGPEEASSSLSSSGGDSGGGASGSALISTLGAEKQAMLAASAASAASAARLVHPLLESGQRVLTQQWETQQRAHQVLSQAMTALTTSFVAHLLSSLSSPDMWSRIARIGYLQQVESLLSTFHSELHMLQDMCFAARALEHCKFTIVQQTEEKTYDHAVFGAHTSCRAEAAAAAAGYAPTPLPAFGSAAAAGGSPPPPPPPPLPPSVPAPFGNVGDNRLDSERSDTPSPPPPPPPMDDDGVMPMGAAVAASAVPGRPVPLPPSPAAASASTASAPLRALPPPPPPKRLAAAAPSSVGASSPSVTVTSNNCSTAPAAVSAVGTPASVAASSSAGFPSSMQSLRLPDAAMASNAASIGGAHSQEPAPRCASPANGIAGGLKIATSPAALVPQSPRGGVGGGIASGAPLSPSAATAAGLKRSASPMGARSVAGGAMHGHARTPSRGGLNLSGLAGTPVSPLLPSQPQPYINANPRSGDDDFLSCCEDDVVSAATGAYPSVNARLMEMSSVQVSLLLPPTAAAVASLPYSTEPPGPYTYANMQAAANEKKKTKWFNMNSSGDTHASAADAQAAQAAAMAGAEAAARAVAGAPFTGSPVLPRPYSAASVVIVIELPPHLYRLLPACLREIEPKAGPNTAAGATVVPAAVRPTHVRQSTMPLPQQSVHVAAAQPAATNEAAQPSPSPPQQEDGVSNSGSAPSATATTAPIVSSTPSVSPPSPSPSPPVPTAATAAGAAPAGATDTLFISSKDGEAPQLSTPLIDVWPVLVTQGVNELQTMANKMSKNDLQQDVNLYALQVMQSYHTAFSRDQRAQLELAQASSKERLRVSSMLQSLLRDLQSMELMVYSFNAEKNIQLLVLCADMVKRMAGGRIICCKSAKDRTSMSVTWDQARILYEQHGLGEHDVQSALNLMRTEGVRKLNVIKNTGQSAYAFNVIQRSFLPPIFRPPEHACSSSIDG